MVHLDDIASHDELFEWSGRLLTEVIEPLGRGESARYSVYDWRTHRFGPPAPAARTSDPRRGRRHRPPRTAPASCGPPVDGDCRTTSPGRADSSGTGKSRGSSGPGGSGPSDGFAEDPSRPFADLLVRQSKKGYEVLPGLRRRLGRTRKSRTVTDQRQCAELVKTASEKFPECLNSA